MLILKNSLEFLVILLFLSIYSRIGKLRGKEATQDLNLSLRSRIVGGLKGNGMGIVMNTFFLITQSGAQYLLKKKRWINSHCRT